MSYPQCFKPLLIATQEMFHFNLNNLIWYPKIVITQISIPHASNTFFTSSKLWHFPTSRLVEYFLKFRHLEQSKNKQCHSHRRSQREIFLQISTRILVKRAENLRRISLKMLICVFLSAKFFRLPNGNLSRTFSEINESPLTGNVFKIKRSQWPAIFLFIAIAGARCEWINCNWLSELLPPNQLSSEYSGDALRKFNEGNIACESFEYRQRLRLTFSRFFTLQIRPQLSWKAFKQIYLFVWRRNEKIFGV